MKTIPTHMNRYGDALESDHIRIEGVPYGHSTHIVVHPEGGRRVYKGPEHPEPMAYCVQHAHVIDNQGGSAAERERMSLSLTIGEPFGIEGFDGVWSVAERDRFNLEGDGYKLVPADNLAEPGQAVADKIYAINCLTTDS